MQVLPLVVRKLIWGHFSPYQLLDIALHAPLDCGTLTEIVRLVPRKHVLKRFRRLCTINRAELVTKLIATTNITTEEVQKDIIYTIRFVCQRGYLGIVQVLINLGFTANYIFRLIMCKKLKKTSEDNCADIVSLLIKAGLIIQDIRATSALRWICTFGHAKTIRMLVKIGLTINDMRAANVLYWVCKYGPVQVMQILINLGITVKDVRSLKHPENSSWSANALEVAFDNSHLEIMQMLLKLGLTTEDTRYVRKRARWRAKTLGDMRWLKIFPEEATILHWIRIQQMRQPEWDAIKEKKRRNKEAKKKQAEEAKKSQAEENRRTEDAKNWATGAFTYR